MRKLIIIDKLDYSSNFSDTKSSFLFWNGHYNNKELNCFSILNIVEENSDSFKSIYLDWINKISATKINNEAIHQKLNIRNIYSFWWQTSFFEKSNYENSQQINDAIKLIAFQEWIKDKTFNEISLISNNKNLAICLKHFFQKKSLIFKFINQNELSVKNVLKFLKKIIPPNIKAIIWLIKKLKYALPLSNIGIRQYHNLKPDIIFVDYLMNFDEKSLKNGKFQSNYWGTLINKINDKSIKTLWIHLPVNLGKNLNYFKNAKEVKKRFNEFNLNSNKLQEHILLDSLINFDVIKQSILDWFEVFKKARNINFQIKIPLIEELNLWPLYKEEWNDSINGVEAISNCLEFNLFDRAFSLQKNNSKLIYLLENQSWEFAMIQAWRKSQAGEIIGYIHSCISYWDMRKYYSPNKITNFFFPVPDKYGLNGDLSKKQFEFNKIDKNKIIQLEATRYLYLNEFRKEKKVIINKKKILLVICDYKDSYTKKQIQLLSEIDSYLNKNFIIKFKPHPAKIKNFLKVYRNKYSIVNEPLLKLSEKADIIFTSNTTTASLEFYFLGKYIISLLDDKNLNLSPLRNIKNVDFISNAMELKKLLQNYKNKSLIRKETKNLFYLNNKLVNWIKLLEDK